MQCYSPVKSPLTIGRGLCSDLIAEFEKRRRRRQRDEEENLTVSALRQAQREQQEVRLCVRTVFVFFGWCGAWLYQPAAIISMRLANTRRALFAYGVQLTRPASLV